MGQGVHRVGLNGIVVTRDETGNVTLRHARWAETEPGRGAFVLTPFEWEDLLMRVAMYELEHRPLPAAAAAPETEPIGQTAGG